MVENELPTHTRTHARLVTLGHAGINTRSGRRHRDLVRASLPVPPAKEWLRERGHEKDALGASGATSWVQPHRPHEAHGDLCSRRRPATLSYSGWCGSYAVEAWGLLGAESNTALPGWIPTERRSIPLLGTSPAVPSRTQHAEIVPRNRR